MSETECPTCGRDDFADRQGMKTHHKRIHDESIAGEPVECEYCGEINYKPPSKAERPERPFCDKDCHGKWMKEQPPEEMPTWKGGGVEITCSHCGNTKRVGDWHHRRSEEHFCSPECYGEWRSNNIYGENHPDWNRVVVACEWCGSEKETRRSAAEKYENHFCNNDCRIAWERENHPTGEDNPLYRGGHFFYGKGWTDRKKRRVRIRDQARCRSCRTSESDHFDEYGRALDVHHITPARQFDDPEKRNAEENLITLCVTCHNEWEQMAPLRPDTAPAGD